MNKSRPYLNATYDMIKLSYIFINVYFICNKDVCHLEELIYFFSEKEHSIDVKHLFNKNLIQLQKHFKKHVEASGTHEQLITKYINRLFI